ncbi:MAG: SdrD B-like domain-containing protein, partial [Angustibacter sp.]
ITTDADGFYEFPNLAPDEYIVKFDAPEGFVPTIVGAAGSTEENDSNGLQAVVGLLASGEVTTNIDAGFYPPSAAIGDFVWADLDGDGRAETGEQGLAGVKVELFAADGSTPITQDAAGKPLAPITTSSSGSYLFDNLAAGTYTVKMTPPSGWEPTASGLDSRGASFPATITAGVANLSADAGFLKPVVQLGDFVWLDADHDGVQDASESGLAGVKVQLYAANGADLVVADTYGTAIAPIVTAADGKYAFKDLPPGQYIVKFAPPAGYEPTLTGQGTGSTDSNGVEARPAALAAGQVDITQDSGFWQPGGNIGDFVWSDANANGVQDTGESGLSGVKVQLFAADGSTPVTSNMFGEPLAPITTGADGKYGFAELRPGQYVVKFAPPRGYLPTKVGSGTSSTDSNGLTGAAVLNSGQSDLGIDSGFVAYGSIGDLVWLDDNGDGERNASEIKGVPGVKVSLLAEDGKALATTSTDAQGGYEFLEVAPASYRLRFEPPNDLIFTAPAAGADRSVDSDPDAQTGITPIFAVAPGQQVTAIDAGLSPGSVISGVVFEDKNDNGRQDADEPGISAVVITLAGTDRFGNPVKRQALTDAEGRYRFVVQPGTYTLSQIQPDGFQDGQDRPGSAGGDALGDKIMEITVGVGEDADGYTFGEQELTDPPVPPAPVDPPAPLDPPNQLPQTGVDALGLSGLAIGLLLLGMMLVRRRRARYAGHRRG